MTMVEDPDVVAASARVHLDVIPVDFDGPICVKCKHSKRLAGPYSGPRDFICLAYEAREIRPAQRNTITNEIQPAWIERARCHEKNGNGECARFELLVDVFVDDETIDASLEGASDEVVKSDAEVFSHAWSTMLAKLNGNEREMIDNVVSGAQVNHTAVYMLIAFVLGTLAGVAGMALWG
jgi:hypothetical protein